MEHENKMSVDFLNNKYYTGCDAGLCCTDPSPITKQQHKKCKERNPARFFENNILTHSLKAVPGYIRKKHRKHCLLTKISSRRITRNAKFRNSVGKRVCNVLRLDYVAVSSYTNKSKHLAFLRLKLTLIQYL